MNGTFGKVTFTFHLPGRQMDSIWKFYAWNVTYRNDCCWLKFHWSSYLRAIVQYIGSGTVVIWHQRGNKSLTLTNAYQDDKIFHAMWHHLVTINELNINYGNESALEGFYWGFFCCWLVGFISTSSIEIDASMYSRLCLNWLIQWLS